jgi:uncharacterized membrane protein YfhO
LNTKYVIGTDSIGQFSVQNNIQALGNAWFVKSVKIAKDPNEAVSSVGTFDPKTTAIIEQKDLNKISQKSTDSTQLGTISLTKYTLNHLTYSSDSNQDGFAVFSEIYYRGNKDWKSYIDGKEVPHVATDYILRGLSIPAGKHQIEFKFEPETVIIGNKIDAIASIGLLLFIALALGITYKQTKKTL